MQPRLAVGVGHLVDQRFQWLWHTACVQWQSLALDYFHRVRADIGGLAVKSRQQKRPKRIDIGTLVRLPVQLFRRGIGVFACKFVTDNGFRAGVGVLGDAEIDNHGVGRFAVAQDDIVRRQIAVHDIFGMGRDQPFGDAPRHHQQIGGGHAAIFDLLVQPGPFDVVHHQIDKARIGALIVIIPHNGVVADFAHFFFARHQRKEIFVARIL